MLLLRSVMVCLAAEKPNIIYTLTANSGALVRLLEATVIEVDFGHSDGSEVSCAIRRRAGWPWYYLYYHRDSAAAPALKLQWSSAT